MTVRPLALACVLMLAGCGGDGDAAERGPHPAERDPSIVPIPIGPAPRWQPPSLSPAVRAARPVDGMRCDEDERDRFGVHVELFA